MYMSRKGDVMCRVIFIYAIHLHTFDLLYLSDGLVIDLVPAPLVADHVEAVQLV